MPTPSIQTLVTDAQQILNLDSISAVRSVVAVALANANTGTPLNPNLTTQQLWNEFYQVVTKPKSDIESIIANQLMKLLYAPPAPGGAGANKQVIFNDGGVLSGSPDLLYDGPSQTLTLAGTLSVTGSGPHSIAGNLSLPSGYAWLNANSASWPTRLLLENLNNGGYGVDVVWNLYDYTNSAQFSTIRARSSYGGPAVGGLLAFKGKKFSSSAEIDIFSFYGGGDVAVHSGNVIMGTSGKGIDFSATASGSGTMTSELLNDYEEGTWTGTLKGSVSDPTTPVTATGIYTKVGKLVTITIAYSNVNTTGASGNVTITGLPFVGAATGAGSVITFDMFTTSTTLACWNVGTTIAFYVSGGFIPATHNAGASRNVNVTMTYFV